MREDLIRTAIENLSGDDFERFARELVRRELYPALNPTSRSHDLGEDARTEPTTVFMHDGLSISLAISKTATWGKLHEDCLRCKETQRRIDTLVFVTAGDPRTDTVQENWRKLVNQEFGWDLEVRALRWLAPVASQPKYESLVDDHLGIPPPGGDFIQTIEREFSRITAQALLYIHNRVPGIDDPFPRDEVNRIEDQLAQGRPVILSGDAGTGKSGIGKVLADSAKVAGKVVLLLDARRVASISSETALRQHLCLNGPIVSAIGRVGRYEECRLIFDQVDNIAGSVSAELLVELARECSTLKGVDVVLISRKREGHEAKLLDRLTDEGFVELTSYLLNENKAAEVLVQLGVAEPSSELITIGQNLLNLELIGRIKQEQPDFDFTVVTDEIDLWERYMDLLVEREAIGSRTQSAEQVIAEAVRLAHGGLNSEDRTFCLDYPLSHSHRRLISWNIIVIEDGRIGRFYHEKFQDFLYAWDAAQRRAMCADVLSEIDAHRSRNVFAWMDKIYARENPELHAQFLRDVLLNA